ncbi:hypothetical protein ACJX0J_020135, partial [Zea mays]
RDQLKQYMGTFVLLQGLIDMLRLRRALHGAPSRSSLFFLMIEDLHIVYLDSNPTSWSEHKQDIVSSHNKYYGITYVASQDDNTHIEVASVSIKTLSDIFESVLAIPYSTDQH